MSIFDKFKKKLTAPKKVVKEDKPKKSVRPVEDKKELTLDELRERDGKKVTKKGVKKTAKQTTDVGLSYKWLIKPVITEKATYLGAVNKYVFEVVLNANKIEIKKAIEKLYNVEVVKVNIIRSGGKSVTYGRITGRTKRKKKAIVTLKSGQTIEVYEGV